MQIPVIKSIIEKYTVDKLKQAEDDLLNEKPLAIDIEGKDEGEKLTHILAAIWCLEAMQQRGLNAAQAIREYGIKVRTSIS